MEPVSQIEFDSAKLGGQPVFRGTRVLVQALFDYLEGGETIGEFLKDFPSVSQKQIVDVLEECKEQAFGAHG